jgi:hypothetical protein
MKYLFALHFPPSHFFPDTNFNIVHYGNFYESQLIKSPFAIKIQDMSENRKSKNLHFLQDFLLLHTTHIIRDLCVCAQMCV